MARHFRHTGGDEACPRILPSPEGLQINQHQRLYLSVGAGVIRPVGEREGLQERRRSLTRRLALCRGALTHGVIEAHPRILPSPEDLQGSRSHDRSGEVRVGHLAVGRMDSQQKTLRLTQHSAHCNEALI